MDGTGGKVLSFCNIYAILRSVCSYISKEEKMEKFEGYIKVVLTVVLNKNYRIERNAYFKAFQRRNM